MTPVMGREAAGSQSPATSFNLQRSELSAEASRHSAGWRTLPLVHMLFTWEKQAAAAALIFRVPDRRQLLLTSGLF